MFAHFMVIFRTDACGQFNQAALLLRLIRTKTKYMCKVTNYVVVSCLKECNGIVLSVYRHFGKWTLLRVYRVVDTGKVYGGLTQHDVSQTERQLCPTL
jgi:hypothetical protein